MRRGSWTSAAGFLALCGLPPYSRNGIRAHSRLVALIPLLLPSPGEFGGAKDFRHHYNTFQVNDDAFVDKSKHVIRVEFVYRLKIICPAIVRAKCRVARRRLPSGNPGIS